MQLLLLLLLHLFSATVLAEPQLIPGQHRTQLSQHEIAKLVGVRDSALNLAVARGIFCSRATMGTPLYMTRDVDVGSHFEWVAYVNTYPGASSYSRDRGACFVSGFYKFTYVQEPEKLGKARHTYVSVKPN